MRVQSILTIIIGALTVFIAYQQVKVQKSLVAIQGSQRKIDEAIKNRDEVAFVVELVGSDDKGKVELGGSLLIKLSNENELLKDLETVIKKYSTTTDDESAGAALQSGIRNATAQDPKEREKFEKDLINLSPIRLVFHVSKKKAKDQLRCVKKIERAITGKFIQNRQIEFRKTEEVDAVPNNSDLRRLKKLDSVEIKNELIGLLRKYIPDIVDRDKSDKYDHRKDVRPGTFEVWLSESFKCPKGKQS
jgi:hypothetical protein